MGKEMIHWMGTVYGVCVCVLRDSWDGDKYWMYPEGKISICQPELVDSTVKEESSFSHILGARESSQ